MLKKRLFGSGQSETLDRAQLVHHLDASEKLGAAERSVETITCERPAGPAPKRTLPAASFAHLQNKQTIVIELPAVQADPSLYERIGEERTFVVGCRAAPSSSNPSSAASIGTGWTATVRRSWSRRPPRWCPVASPRPG